MLYIVATPIGNLEDITLRALRILGEADFILCEDTRKSSILLNHYKIKKPCISFHKFSEKRKENEIITYLKDNKNICLISDAGTPCVSDPGYNLVKRCIEEKLPITSIPGPCSLILALILSGFETNPFSFYGFLPKKDGEKKSALKKILSKEHTSIFFDTLHKILNTLEIIHKLTPDRKILIARELTKKFEQTIQDTASNLISYFKNHPLKGEIVVVIEKGKLELENLEIEEIVTLLKEQGLDTKKAIEKAAKILKKPKKEVYKKCCS